ncbi:hypothetical protein BDV59DRAFT_134299 [Aspergillus ambiguus]|uniref:uncharacterized protein n=1 Tax=Aspergillus ambiguus TaxID=176160 RepID=UPI003CCCCAEE
MYTDDITVQLTNIPMHHHLRTSTSTQHPILSIFLPSDWGSSTPSKVRWIICLGELLLFFGFLSFFRSFHAHPPISHICSFPPTPPLSDGLMT